MKLANLRKDSFSKPELCSTMKCFKLLWHWRNKARINWLEVFCRLLYRIVKPDLGAYLFFKGCDLKGTTGQRLRVHLSFYSGSTFPATRPWANHLLSKPQFSFLLNGGNNKNTSPHRFVVRNKWINKIMNESYLAHS